MTKFILVGGSVSYASDHGRAFCHELTVGFAEPVKILLVLFARPISDWPVGLERDQQFFHDKLPDRPFEMQLAKPAEFTSQVKWADAIWIKGGETEPLMQALNRDPAWQGHLDGKCVGGTSAGAYALADTYHEIDRPIMGHGLGLVPVKVSAHWQSATYHPQKGWDSVRSQLEAASPALPVLLLREGEYRVF